MNTINLNTIGNEKVVVKKVVEGGNGGMKYYLASEGMLASLIQFSMMVKVNLGGTMILPSGILAELKVSEVTEWYAFAVDTTQKMSVELIGGSGLMTIKDILSNLDLTEITEEEFYTL